MTAVPFKVKGIDHVVLRVADLDRAVEFYCGVLGCKIEREQAEIGLTQLRAGASLIDLLPVDGPLGRAGGGEVSPDGRNMDHFALAIDSFDEAALARYLTSRGIRIEASGPRYGAAGEGPSVYVRDPDGNMVELKGPPFQHQ